MRPSTNPNHSALVPSSLDTLAVANNNISEPNNTNGNKANTSSDNVNDMEWQVICRMNNKRDSMDRRSILVWGVEESVSCMQVLRVLTNANLGFKIAGIEYAKRMGMIDNNSRRVQVIAKSKLDRDSLFILAQPIFRACKWHSTKSLSFINRALRRARSQLPSSSPNPAQPMQINPSTEQSCRSQQDNPYSVLGNVSEQEAEIEDAPLDSEVTASSAAAERMRAIRNTRIIVDDDLSHNLHEDNATDDDEPQRHAPDPAQLRLATFNANRKFAQHYMELATFCHDERLDVIGLTETSLKAKTQPTIKPAHYRWFGKSRGDDAFGGGVGFLVANHVAPFVNVMDTGCRDGEDDGGLEALFIKIRGDAGNADLIVGVVYLQPENSAAIRAHQFNQQWDRLDTLLSIMRQKTDKLVLMGDFNAHVGKPANQTEQRVIGSFGETKRNSRGNKLIKLLLDQGLIALNARSARGAFTYPPYTYVPKHLMVGTDEVDFEANPNGDVASCSIVDYIIVTQETAGNYGPHTVYEDDIIASDHRLSYVALKHWPKRQPRKGKLMKLWRLDRLQDQEVREAFQAELTNQLQNWSTDKWAAVNREDVHSAQQAVDEAYSSWLRAVETAATKTIGVKRVHRGFAKPWFTEQVKKAIKRRTECYANLNKFNTSAQDWAKYKQLTKAAAKTLQHAKTTYFKQVTNNLNTDRKTNSKRFWASIKRFAYGKFRPLMQAVRDANGQVVSEPEQVKQVWAAYLKKLGTPLVDDSFDDDHFVQVQQANQARAEQSFGKQDHPHLAGDWTIQDVDEAFSGLIKGKATGVDGIPNDFLIAFPPCARLSFLNLANLVKQLERRPTVWGRGLVSFIYKKGDALEPANYRGITLLSCPAKAYDRMMATRIRHFASTPCNTANVPQGPHINEEQGGFRNRRSCIDQAYTLWETIVNRLRMGQGTHCLFLDFKKAFDIVWHDGLWDLLWKQGVQGNSWRMLRTMYQQAKSSVLVNGELTDEFSLNQGVRQGCTVSPDLFLLYINPILEFLRQLNHQQPDSAGVTLPCDQPAKAVQILALLFADDVVELANERQSLANMLSATEEYCSLYRLLLNAAKSAIMHFSGNRLRTLYDPSKGGKRNPPEPVRSLSQPNVLCFNYVNAYDYLGVIFMRNLQWTDHATKLRFKALDQLNKVARTLCNHGLTVKSRLTVYKAMVRPILEYGAELITVNSKVTKELERVQLKAAKYILGCNRHTNDWAVRADLGLLRLETRRDAAKLRYLARLLLMDDSRLAKRAFLASSVNATHYQWRAKGSVIRPWTQLAQALVDQYDLSSNLRSLKQDIAAMPAIMDEATKAKRSSELYNKWCSDVYMAAGRKESNDFMNSQQENLYLIKTCKQGRCNLFGNYYDSVMLESYLDDNTANSAIARIKFRLRSGTHALNSSLAHNKNNYAQEWLTFSDEAKREAKKCSLCNTGESETTEHFLIDCPAFTLQRSFLIWLMKKQIGAPRWNSLSSTLKAAVLLGGEPVLGLSLYKKCKGWVQQRVDQAIRQLYSHRGILLAQQQAAPAAPAPQPAPQNQIQAAARPRVIQTTLDQYLRRSSIISQPVAQQQPNQPVDYESKYDEPSAQPRGCQAASSCANHTTLDGNDDDVLVVSAMSALNVSSDDGEWVQEGMVAARGAAGRSGQSVESSECSDELAETVESLSLISLNPSNLARGGYALSMP